MGMGRMGIENVGMGGNGNVKSHSRSSLLQMRSTGAGLTDDCYATSKKTL